MWVFRILTSNLQYRQSSSGEGEETGENHDMQDGGVTELTTVKEVIKK